MKRTAKLAGLVAAALLVALTLGFGLLQTGMGRTWLAGAIGATLSGPGERVTLSGLDGFVPFDVRVGAITLSDAAGPHLALEDATIVLSAKALLAGRLVLRRLDAARVTIMRPGGPGASGGSTDLAALLNPPLAIQLSHVEIGALALGAPVLGTAMTLAVTGHGAVGGGAADADVALRRIDGTPGVVTLHLAYGGAAPHLAVHAAVSEPTGTVLAALLHRDESLPLELHLDGDGALDDWQGSLSARAGGAAAVAATLHIAGRDPSHLSLSGTLAAAALLPPALRPLAGERTSFAADMSFASDGIALERLTVESGAARFAAQGRYGGADGALDATARLALPALAPLAPLLGSAIDGAGEVELTLGGSLARPTVDATLGIQGLHLAVGTVARANATLSLRPQGDPRAAPTMLSGSGRVEGLVPGAGVLPAGLGDTITWRLGATLDPQRMEIAAGQIAIADAGATLGATATIGQDGAAGEMRLVLPDLAQLTGSLAGGALDLTADFRAATDGIATAVLSGAVDRPRAGTAQTAAALGARVAINLVLSRSADGAIEARDVAIDAAAARLTGSGRRDPDGRLAADFTAALPHLAALDRRIAGAATLTGHVAGPPDAPAGMLALDAPSLAAGGVAISGLSARLALGGGAPSALRLDARFRVNGLDATVTAEGARAAGGVLRVTRLDAAAGGARMGGAVTLADGEAKGKLHAIIPDLRPWSRLAGEEVSGRAELDAQIAGRRYALTLDASDLDSSGPTKLTARHVRLAAEIADPFARPTGRAELSVTGAEAGGVALSTAKLTGNSDRPGHFALDGDAQGRAGATGAQAMPAGTFALTAGASLGIERGSLDLSLTRLAGAVGRATVALKSPLAIAWRDGSGSFTGLALALAGGSVTGAGEIGSSRVALHLLARGLPLQPMARLGGTGAVEGKLGFELTLSGTRAAPDGQLVFDGEQLRFAALSRPDLPPLGLVMNAVWRDGRLAVQGRLAGPKNAAIGWSGSLPLTLDPARLAFDMARTGAVALHLEGDGELADIADLLPLGEDRIAGRFTIDAGIAGTVGSPTANGRLGVENGRYESLATGAILSGVRFALVGDRDHLVLRDFAASDGAGGSLTASGAVDLAGKSGPALDLAVELQHFRALHRDEGNATASGTVRVAGTVAAPRVQAALTIDQADIAVPERLPQSLRPVNAVIIDSATGAMPPPATAASERPALLTVALDVTIALPGKVFVRGRGLDSEWRGRIAITGTQNAPVVSGKLAVVHGTFDFIGKSFVVTDGTVTFLGGKSIDPTVDIQAQAQSTDVTAIVAVTGTATQPTIKLSSEPDLPRDEILARLLFGTSMSQISPAQGLELASAAASLAGGDSLDVLGKLRRGLGLDRLTLGSAPSSVVPGIGVPSIAGQPASGPATGLGTTPLVPGSSAIGSTAGSTALNAGKYVANGVYVGVSQGLDASSSAVTVTIDVSRHVTVDTEAGQASGSGIGVNWKLDY